MKCFAWGTLAAGLLLVSDSTVGADDLVRAVGTNAPATTLQFDGKVQTQPVLFGLFGHGHHRGWGCYCYGSYYPSYSYGYGSYPYSGYGYGYGYGGYPYSGGGYGGIAGYGYGGVGYTGYGYGGGYSGGYGGYSGYCYGSGYPYSSGYGGYTGYGYGGYPYSGYGNTGYGYGGYPYGGGYGGYSGYGYGGYGSGYGGYSGYGHGYPGYDRYYSAGYGGGYNYLCRDNAPVMVPAATLGTPRQPVAPVPNNGTFQYDGGPNNPAPIPSSAPARPTIPRDGKFVSLPRESTGFVHPAVITTVRPAVPVQPRYTYPAYGDR